MASSTSCSQADGIIANNHELTPLEKHVMFFDINNDGIIYPSETYQAFRKMGRGIFRSMFAAVLIHFNLSHKTRPGKCPSLFFPIVVENIKYAIHGSDSGAYDSEGRANAFVDWNSLFDLGKNKNEILTKETSP
ncbi:hypothetical protein KY290_023179 [Solanum tuberosum]|uniref:Uncharacterized protein n=1 Tax=Solanum tuberosum TaxID=4113 RepID=A0ABQ7V6L3_SOLTU|nr:hypothetical protein KY290_023179 [Solanum tuberosum]